VCDCQVGLIKAIIIIIIIITFLICCVVGMCCRLVLRCRQDARSRFAKMRSDVLVKLELLDNKHGFTFTFSHVINTFTAVSSLHIFISS